MQKTKRNPGTIKAKQKFYDFCVRSGIDLKNLDVEKLNFDKLPKYKSSFKTRSEEVKTKFNYNFKMREQNFMEEYPNIEKLTFIKK